MGSAGHGDGAVRVLICDDHPAMVRGLVDVCEDAGMVVVATATDGQEAIAAYEQHRPDVALIDVKLRGDGISGVDVVRGIRSFDPGARIILQTGFDHDPQVVADALAAGAVGFLHKGIQNRALARQLAEVAGGGEAFDSESMRLLRVASRPATHPPVAPSLELTAREIDVMQLVAEGKTNAEVGTALGISLNTVKTYLERIFPKLGVERRAAAVLEAMRRGYVRLD